MSEMFAGGVLGFFVGWFVTVFIINWTEDHNKSQSTCKAPKREWVGLTTEEFVHISYEHQRYDESNEPWFDRGGFARAIEQLLKEKNA